MRDSRHLLATARLCCFALAWAIGCVLAGTSQAQEVPVVRFEVTGFEVTGANPLAAAETTAVLADYTGTYEGLDALLAAVDALQQALADRGYNFYRVVLPPQTLDSGSVRLDVVQFKLGAVRVDGNSHQNDANILRALPSLKPGASPDARAIGHDLDVANRHPAKNLNVRLSESQEQAAIDAVVTVKDRRAWSLFAGINNIGTKQTGRTRLSVGGQHANLFNRDHRLTVSYTTSPENLDDVDQLALSYQAPVYRLHGFVDAFYSRSNVDVGQVGDFTVSGAGRFWGASFNQVLRRQGSYRHQWTIGVQNRLFVNDVNFLGLVPFGVDVRSTPLVASYAGRYDVERWSASFDVSYQRNLVFGDDNDRTAYALSRFGAARDWDAFRFNYALNYALPRGFLLRAHGDGQYAGEPLISGEQFGVGGMRSVRGLDERAATGDNGLRVSFETWSPPIERLAGLRLLAFYDLGYRDREQPQPGEFKDDVLSSAGIGARWNWREDLSVTLDYGHTLAAGEPPIAGADDVDGVKWHFNVFYRF